MHGVSSPDLSQLRPWQRQALTRYLQETRADFLVTATPGAGKTRFALTVAQQLAASGDIDAIIIVAPTDHLRTQWAHAAHECGLNLDPTLPNTRAAISPSSWGYVTTYAQVAARPISHRLRCEARRPLVILDEIHHAGDGLSWGDSISSAFETSHRRLALSGTPFRTRPDETIPFVRYETSETTYESIADFSYSYADALRDGVVRPVVFAAYSGQATWRNSAGEVLTVDLAEQADDTGAGLSAAAEKLAWKTALNPRGKWVAHVLAAMDDRITAQRAQGITDAAGIVLASDQSDARAYAKILERVTGHKPVLVLSDDRAASTKLRAFTYSRDRYAVCVRMISEGCDIPRATSIAYMTSYRTPLFFAQAVGRVVRSRASHETATVFLPAVRPLLALAAELEEQRNRTMRVPPTSNDQDLDALIDEREQPTETTDEWEPISAEAQFAHVVHAGRAVTAPTGTPASPDDDYLGIPGLLTPEQTAALLAARDADARKRAGTAHTAATESAGETEWEKAARLRKELTHAVAAVAQSAEQPHAVVRAWVNREIPGPTSSSAPPDILDARIRALRRRLVTVARPR